MNLPQKLRMTFARALATGACLVALVAYIALAPPRSRADDDFCLEGSGGCGACECVKNGQTTTEGGCVGGQTCQCIHGTPANTCTSCVWNSGCS